MEIHDVVVEVKELRKRCPVYKIGDRIYFRKGLEGSWVMDIEKTKIKEICVSAFPALVGEIVKVRHAIQDIIHVQCLDPGPPYTENSVVFEIKKVE
ncbi:MAG: TIGR04076 family protein [bacterium]|nr:TIGR04076 family protein [bacterium]